MTVAAEPYRVRDQIPLPLRTAPVPAQAEKSDRYLIHVVRSLPQAIECVTEMLDAGQVALVTDSVVEPLYGGVVLRALRSAGVDVGVHVVPAGEQSKSLREAGRLWHRLAHGTIGRRDAVLALGGGVIADLAGWVASAYMRGLPYVNLPTTLLAQVDGAIGGKVAVNHRVAKNLLGAFHQPAGVVSNVAFLRSLESRHVAAGLAECIKKGMIASPEYLDFIGENAEPLLRRDLDALEKLVHGAAAIKTALVARDPYEQDLRRPLNFGHTVGHPVETVCGYGALLHGEAVAFGMVVESRIAAARGWLAVEDLERLVELLRRCRLPTQADELPSRPAGGALLAAMEKVRLIRGGSLRFVLPLCPGETAIVDDVGEEEVRAALAACGVPGSAPGLHTASSLP